MEKKTALQELIEGCEADIATYTIRREEAKSKNLTEAYKFWSNALISSNRHLNKLKLALPAEKAMLEDAYNEGHMDRGLYDKMDFNSYYSQFLTQPTQNEAG